jgi:pimeloyl-ACP methyl ester carboxylesterase
MYKMPLVINEGIRIHYEVEGQGPPLVLQHDLFGSTQSWWLNGYVDELSKDYKLILTDAHGHGESGKPHEMQAYNSELMTGDIVVVLDVWRLRGLISGVTRWV